MFFDNGLYIANFGAGGINDFDAAFLNFFSFSRGNTVGTNNQDSIFSVLYFFDIFDRIDAAVLEQFNCLWNMNQRTVSINTAAGFMLRYLQHNIHSPAYTHAEARSPGKFNFHFALSFALK